MLQTVGVILGIVFVIACSVATGITFATYLIKKNNKCSCVQRWERLRK
jgi:high-affinity Fe2+/Pb2+ permease